MAARALREDVENQAGAIDDTPVKHALQITLLRRCERMIEDHELYVVCFAGDTQFIGLAAADEQCSVGARAAAGDRDSGMGARAFREQAEFFETGDEIDLAEVDADKRCVDQISGYQNRSGRGGTPTGGVLGPAATIG
jgi:hypothetical protein